MRRRGAARLLDCFVAVPSGDGAPMDELRGAVRRGARPLRGRRVVVRGARASRPGSTRSGARTAACRGRGSSSLRCGSREAASPMPPAHASCLAMLAPVMTMREGAAIYAPGGALLEAGDLLRPAGARRGARARPRRRRGVGLPTGRSRTRSSRSSRSATACCCAPISSRTSRAGRRRSRCAFAGRRVATRAGLSGVPETLARFDPSGGDAALLAALDDGRDRRRAHDEPHRRRRRRVRVRADDEPRSRLRRLPARSRPAPEQHARRDRPRPRAARARASGWRA